jgi:hypothetical protein
MAQPQPPLNRPYQKEVGLGPRVDYAQLGVSTALFGICGTIVAGAVAYARGNKAFYDKMFRTRMIVVVSVFGLRWPASAAVAATTSLLLLPCCYCCKFLDRHGCSCQSAHADCMLMLDTKMQLLPDISHCNSIQPAP